MPEEPNNEATPQEPELNPEIVDEQLETVSDEPTLEVNEPENVPSVVNEEAAAPISDPVAEVTPELTPEPIPEPVFESPVQPEAAPVAPMVFGSGPEQPSEVSAQEDGVPQKKGKKKALIVGGIIAAALAVLVGGSALAYNLWYQNPNKVVTDAVVNAIAAKTISVTGSLEAKSDDYTLKVDVAGRNTLEARSTAAVTLAFSSDDINFTVKGEGIYSAEGDIYVKLDDARKLADSIEKQSDGQMSFDVFDGVIEKIDGNWIKISSEDLGDFSEDYKATQKCFAAISKQLDSDKAFRKTVETETEALYKAHQFIIVGDKIGTRTINGQGSLGYKLTGDDKAAAAFFRGLGDTQLGKKLTECNKDIKFDDFADQTEAEDSSATGEAEIWVSRFGHAITELNVKAQDDDTKTSFVLNPIFNKNEAVEIPSKSISLSELKSDIEKAYEEYYQSYYDSYYSNASTTTSSTEFN